MIEFTDIGAIHKPANSITIWRCVKRMRDIKPRDIKDGGEYLVKKSATGPVMIYRAVNGKLKPTGDQLMRWGIFGDDEQDVIRARYRSGPTPLYDWTSSTTPPSCGVFLPIVRQRAHLSTRWITCLTRECD